MTTDADRAPVTFGLFDGVTTAVGVILGASAHPAAVFPAAVGVGAAAMAGMAAGQWLSASGSGLAAAAAIGLATGAAVVIPALPYLLLSGWAARGWSGALVLAVAAVIIALRRGRGTARAAAETMGVLAAVAAVVYGCVWLVPVSGTA